MVKQMLIVFMLGLFGFSLSGQGLSSSESYTKNIIDLQNEISLLDDEHCEVPCGIYGDSLRVMLIKEHASTIEKAMKQINDLSVAESVNYNQLIRWVNNKEKHAEEIQNIVAQYFLHQRIKSPKKSIKDKKARMKAETKYRDSLVKLHEVLVYAMKCKQTTDQKQVSKLNSAVEAFESLYFHKHPH